MGNNKLKISVVTVSYNAAETIEETIQSVVNQTYDNIEYIIIDGGSTDGTVDIIKKYADRIAYWVSEPDKGIYDAMNKGINVATGDYINFMNAGDTFTKRDIVEKVADKIFIESFIVICDWNDIKKNCLIERKALEIKYLKRNILCSHQAMLIKLSYHKNNLYDTTFRFCADYNFLYKSYYNDGVSIQYIPIAIANYLQDEGYSADNIYKLEKEKIRIWSGNYFKNFIIIEITNLRRRIWKFCSTMIPEKMGNNILRYYLSKK